jgi:hypothetical protein
MENASSRDGCADVLRFQLHGHGVRQQWRQPCGARRISCAIPDSDDHFIYFGKFKIVRLPNHAAVYKVCGVIDPAGRTLV